MKAVFGDVYYTQLEWEQRKQLGPLAKRLHGLYASHKQPFPMKVATLREGCGSDTKELCYSMDDDTRIEQNARI